MGTILGFILNLVGSSAFGAIADFLKNKSNVDAQKFIAATGAERDVIIAQAKANQEIYHDQATLAQLRWGSKWMQVLVFLAAIGPVLHFASVYLVSTFTGLRIVIDAVPAAYADQEFKVIATLVGYSVAQSGLSVIGRFARK